MYLHIETGGASYHHTTKTQVQQRHTFISFDFHYNRKTVMYVNTSTILLADQSLDLTPD